MKITQKHRNEPVPVQSIMLPEGRKEGSPKAAVKEGRKEGRKEVQKLLTRRKEVQPPEPYQYRGSGE